MSAPETTSHAFPSSGLEELGLQLRIYRRQSFYELMKMVRLPMFAVPSLAFPWLFYLLFGVTFAGQGEMPVQLVATYGAFGVIGAGLFSFGVGIASERGQGWHRLQRASPMPVMAYFVGKLFTACVFAVLVVVGLEVLAASLGGVRLPAGSWLSLLGVLVLGTPPFCALGLVLGYLVGPNAAPAVVNLVYLPLSFASGLWIPIEMLPGWMQSLAPALPPYHLGQLALAMVGRPLQQGPWWSAAALAGFTVVALVAARWAYLRDEGRTYG